MDLSYPKGRSANEAIDKTACSMAYILVHDVANTAVALGKESLIATSKLPKIDSGLG